MPVRDHYHPGRPFDIMESDVAAWLCELPEWRQFAFNIFATIIATVIGANSAFAETNVIPLPAATKRQMQAQADRSAAKKRTIESAAAKKQTIEITAAQAHAMAIYAPLPQYPYEARSKHITGIGEFALRFDYDTGLCTGYKTLHSTGSPMLDNVALAALRQWRIRPKTGTVVRIPVTFTMTGAKY